MTNQLARLAATLCLGILSYQGVAAQTTGERPHPIEAPTLSEQTVAKFTVATPSSGAAKAAVAAYSRVNAARAFTTIMSQERATAAQVTDAHLDLYPQTEFLRILASSGRASLVAAPFHAHTRAESGSGSMPGVPLATLSRIYRTDSSVTSLIGWYQSEYGFDFRTHQMPLGNASPDTLTIARAVKRIGNSVVTVMIWNPTSTSRGRSAQSVSLAKRTSVEIQERAYRPRQDLIVEGPDAVVELTWKVPFRDIIQRISSKYQIDPHLVAALVQQESNFNPNAMSVDSAMGLTQMIPGTAAMLGVSDPTNPREALDGGVRYLKSLLRMFKGNVEYALAGYNAGPGNVRKYGGVPPFSETRDYVRRIMARYKEKAGGQLAPAAKVVRTKM